MKIIITEEQYDKIIRSQIKLSESNDYLPPLLKYLKGKPELIPLYNEIEKTLNDTFTEEHFENEIKISGPLKSISNGILPDTINQFNKMKLEVPQISIRNNSYRDYEKQKETFLTSARNHGGTISGGQIQAALPGFSQHHTGKGLDVLNHKYLTPDILKKYGFILPYQNKTQIRMAEPWHIYYNK